MPHEHNNNSKKTSIKTAVFIPCYIHQLKPHIGIAMIQVLERLGCEVEVITEAFCCGQPAFNAGFHAPSKQVVKQFVQAYATYDHIIIPSASCAGFLKNYAHQLFETQDPTQEQLNAVQNAVIEFADFIVRYCNLSDLQLSFPSTLSYHTSCAALREYACTTSTTKLLQQIQGVQLVPFVGADVCCGFGGSFAEKFSDISISMANYKLEKFQDVQVSYVVSNDYSCLLHLESVAKRKNHSLVFLHLAELLVYAMQKDDWSP